MKKRVLVTGGLGFIGYNLVKRLLQTTDYKITVIDNLSSQSSSRNNKHKNVKVPMIPNFRIAFINFFSPLNL